MAYPGENGSTLSVSDSASYHVVNQNLCGIAESDPVTASPVSPDTMVSMNVVTPNGDGKNDAFKINLSLEDSELRIYDRRGLQIFEKQSYDSSWRGESVPSGTYFYFLRDGCSSFLIKGWLQVIKEK